MKIQATDRHGKVHKGANIRHFLISDDNGTPVVVVKETIINDMKNYRILTPNDKEFAPIARALGYEIAVI